MRNIYLFLSLSLDGYFEGPGHDISWHNIDDEINRFALEQLRATDLMLFGRRVYQLMEEAWPRIARDPTASKDNLEIARLMNGTPKIVFSRTLPNVVETEEWRNVRLVRSLDPDEIRRLKEERGKDITVGGSDLALSFLKEGLIDELRFMVTPTVIGAGTRIFQGMHGRLKLELIDTRRFDSGNVLLRYRPKSDR